MKLFSLNRITLPVALLAVGAFCPELHAGWGSIQGNNRSAGAPMQAAAPRPQSQPGFHPQQQPAFRPEPQPAFHPQPSPMIRPEPPRQGFQPAPEQSHPAEHFQPAPAQVDRTPAGEADRRRMDIDQDRSQSYFWSDYHKGMRVDRLPDGYRRFGVHGHDYFYYEGVYYDDEPSGYVVVDAPVDADIPDLPPGAETVEAGGTVYYYVDGAFYIQQADGSYVVVAPPIGVTVIELPSDAVQVVINGTIYYQADGTYYLPVMQNGVTAYLTIPQP
jgi:hypothetical protein